MSKILQVWKVNNYGKGVIDGSQDFFRITPDPSTNGGGAEWGGITGTLSAQTDLQEALNGKVAKADYTPAHSVLAQQSGTGSPTSVQIGTNEILGRLSGGGSNIKGLTTSETRTLLSINNVDNTSDLNKPISTATQTALNNRLDVLISDNAETSLTGVTVETIVRTYPIPANSLNDFAQIETFIQIDKAGGTGNSDVRIYIAPNSDNTTGAIQLVRIRMSIANQSAGLKRIHKLLGTNIRTMLTDVNASNTDETNTGLASSIQTYDRTQLRYLHVTISPASTSESHTLWNVYVLGARLKTTI
jgi:hypothetical protein